MLDGYVLNMAKKKEQRAARLPVDLIAKVQALAEHLFAKRIHSEVNWSETLILILNVADKLGWFDDPEMFLAEVVKESERAAKK